MKLRVATLAAVCIVASAAVSNAAEVKDGNNNTGGGFEPAGDCLTDTDNVWLGEGGGIPDADVTGILLGPVATTDDGTTFADVVLGIDMFHTWIGDLRLQLYYDMDCDGAPEIGPIAAMCRPGEATLDCTIGDGCCGCSDDVDGSYLYSDSGAVSHEDACGPGFQGGGCYALDPASENPLAVLDGVAKGGCFWLAAADGAAGDTGCVLGWSVYANKGGNGEEELCCYETDPGVFVCEPVPVGECDALNGQVVENCDDCPPATPIDEKSWTELKGTF